MGDSPQRVEIDDDAVSDQSVLAWFVGFGIVGGAAGGCYAGWLYGQDQAVTPAAIPSNAVSGLLLGVLIGAIAALPPAGIFFTLQRTSSIGALTRVLMTSMSAAAAISLFLLVLTGFNVAGMAVLFCAAVAAVPAGLATTCLGLRHGRRTARRTAVG